MGSSLEPINKSLLLQIEGVTKCAELDELALIAKSVKMPGKRGKQAKNILEIILELTRSFDALDECAPQPLVRAIHAITASEEKRLLPAGQVILKRLIRLGSGECSSPKARFFVIANIAATTNLGRYAIEVANGLVSTMKLEIFTGEEKFTPEEITLADELIQKVRQSSEREAKAKGEAE